jgi:hypothetical protein
MENRIEINGVWYVREDAINDSLDNLEEEEMDLTFTEECHYETDKYCFIASRIRIDGGDEFYPDITIEFTDKRSANRDTWKEEYWENNNWFKGILEGKAESIVSLDEETDICPQGKKQLKGFLNRLVEVGWLV